MKSKHLLIATLFFGACTTVQEKLPPSFASQRTEIDPTNYCTICDSLETWKGGIQGVELSDSSSIYPMAECHTNKSFDLIWTPKEGILNYKANINKKALDNYYQISEKLNYENLECYVFLIPKTKHTSKKNEEPNCDCEDLNTFDYVFPSKVSVLKRVNNRFVLINEKQVNSFEELGRIKLNTIFGIN